MDWHDKFFWWMVDDITGHRLSNIKVQRKERSAVCTNALSALRVCTYVRFIRKKQNSVLTRNESANEGYLGSYGVRFFMVYIYIYTYTYVQA